MNDRGYLLDNRATEAGSRFDELSALFDPLTFRHLDALGIREGWRCWEVGAGGPSVPRWMSERVGPRGHVLATDIDVSRVMDAAAPNVDIRRHDVGRDEPPAGAFDLAHARLVLVHVVERDQALRNLVASLRPGGVLLIEDADPALQPLPCLETYGPEQELANKIRSAFRALMSGRGVDLGYGRKLPRLLREAGLTEVAGDCYFPIASPACARLETATINQIRERLIAANHASAEEIEQHLANVAEGRLDLVTAPMISAWGKKPQSPSGP